MSKQSPSERQAELERAAKYNACPDCKRPTARTGAYGACISRGGDQCIRVERDNLRVEMASLRERLPHLEEAARLLRICAAQNPTNAREWPSLGIWLRDDEALAHRQRNNDGNG